MRSQIEAFCKQYDYPVEATASLLADFDKLSATKYFPLFKRYVDMYNEDNPCLSFSSFLSASKNILAKSGVSSYTIDLLYFICLAKHCLEKYEKAGLPMEFYHRSMLDLKWKLMECKKVKNTWGSFVAYWFPRFFDLSRFAMGRLQFEIDPVTEEYEKNGIKMGYGDVWINVHIPSCGKLNIDECMDSFRTAAEFYKDYFPDGIAKFRCHSWLLASIHKQYLPAEGGIRRFADLFDVVRDEPNEKGSDLWRIFGIVYEGSTEGFPTETSLQRAYLKLLADGNTPAWGQGYIFMKDAEIINK